jgi:hypothetical protein
MSTASTPQTEVTHNGGILSSQPQPPYLKGQSVIHFSSSIKGAIHV